MSGVSKGFNTYARIITSQSGWWMTGIVNSFSETLVSLYP